MSSDTPTRTELKNLLDPLRRDVEKLMNDPRRTIEPPRQAPVDAVLPTGQYAGQAYEMVSNNQAAWDFPRAWGVI